MRSYRLTQQPAIHLECPRCVSCSHLDHVWVEGLSVLLDVDGDLALLHDLTHRPGRLLQLAVDTKVVHKRDQLMSDELL